MFDLPPCKSTWIIAVDRCLTLYLQGFLPAMEFYCLFTSETTIAESFPDSDNAVWVLQSTLIIETAFCCFVGPLCEVFGRRYTLLGALAINAIGCIAAGTAFYAHSMALMMLGRTLQ